MMDWLRNWITGVTCVSILLAAVQCLMPSGGVKKVGGLAGGLLLLLAVAAPLMELDMDALSISLTEYRMAQSGGETLLKLDNMQLVKEIIAEQTAAYISDKAKELGISCAVEVTYDYSEEGMAYPVSVIVTGEMTPAQQEKLCEWIECELGVAKENQTCREVVDHETGP